MTRVQPNSALDIVEQTHHNIIVMNKQLGDGTITRIAELLERKNLRFVHIDNYRDDRDFSSVDFTRVQALIISSPSETPKFFAKLLLGIPPSVQVIYVRYNQKTNNVPSAVMNRFIQVTL